jgi:hypothetical protein
LIVGGLVIVFYLAALVGYMQGMKGTAPTWAKMASRLGAVLLLLQIALGFSLLGTSDDRPNAIHYVVGLAAILTVAGEHMFASQETDQLKRNRLNLIFVLATLILVFAAFAIGESTSA